MNIKERIRNYALDIGFDLCGFTSADKFEDLKPLLEARKAKDYLSGFEEQNIEHRIDPKLSLPEAKTIIVLGKADPNYAKQAKDLPEGAGALAKYTWSLDYHQVFKNLFPKLEEFLRDELGAQKIISFVDTGPLVERAVAVRANLGWIGKNYAFIAKEYGSWVALGEVLMDLEIEPDLPEDLNCLNCMQCITACPTGAISANQDFNAKKCLSYLSQTKGIIPHEYRILLGDRLFGCDTCQNICPHNKLQEAQARTEDCSSLDLKDVLSLSNKEFKSLYGQQAFAWRGKGILQRNALIIIGNKQDSQYFPFLLPFLKNENPMLRGYAVWALAQIDRDKVKPYLENLLTREKDHFVRSEIQDSLENN